MQNNKWHHLLHVQKIKESIMLIKLYNYINNKNNYHSNTQSTYLSCLFDFFTWSISQLNTNLGQNFKFSTNFFAYHDILLYLSILI